jgi:hypothetical protein
MSLNLKKNKTLRAFNFSPYKSPCILKPVQTLPPFQTYDDYNISKISQADMDSFEIQIRTSNIIKSAESLSKIISDLKDLTILNDFKSLNAQITNQCAILKKNELEIDMHLTKKKDLMVKLLHDLQHEYYTSK